MLIVGSWRMDVLLAKHRSERRSLPKRLSHAETGSLPGRCSDIVAARRPEPLEIAFPRSRPVSRIARAMFRLSVAGVASVAVRAVAEAQHDFPWSGLRACAL